MTSEFQESAFQYRLNSDIALNVTLQREKNAEIHDASLLDITNTGIWLRTTAGLLFEETITVRIIVPEIDFEFEFVSQVSWIKPASDGHWRIGCPIQPPISEEMLNQLANLDYIDRRSKPRDQVNLPGVVTAELQQCQTAVTIQCVSKSGFGFLASEPCPVHQKIMLKVDNGTDEILDFTARVEWEFKSGNDYRYGCSFLSPSDYEGLRGLIEVESVTTEPDDTTSVTKVRQGRVWAFLAAFIVFVVPCFLVISIDAERSPAMFKTPNRVQHLAEKVDVSNPENGVSKSTTITDFSEASERPDQQQASNSQELQPEEDEASPPPNDELWHFPVGYREWIDNTGQYQVIALLEDVQGDVVRLRKENGRHTSVSLARLSQEDVSYVLLWLQTFNSQ
jgi:hypothetical protein